MIRLINLNVQQCKYIGKMNLSGILIDDIDHLSLLTNVAEKSIA